MKQFYVYELVVVPDETVCYVGKGTRRRMYIHRRNLKNSRYNQTGLYRRLRALLSSGKDFEPRKVFETDDESEALQEEQRRIQSYGFENLFNSTTRIGLRASDVNDMIREAMSKARLEYVAKLKAETGQSSLPEVRAKISASNVGRQASEETRQKLSKSLSATYQGHFSAEHHQALKVPKVYTPESKRLRNERAGQIMKQLWDSGQMTGSRGQKLHFKNPEERNQRISTAKKGVPVPLERRLRISQTLTGRVNGPHSQETRTKISKSLTGKTSEKRLESRRKRCQERHVVSPDGQTFTIPPGEFYRFCEQHGLSSGNLGQVLRGQRKHHKGWKVTLKNSSRLVYG